MMTERSEGHSKLHLKVAAAALYDCTPSDNAADAAHETEHGIVRCHLGNHINPTVCKKENHDK